MQFLLTLTYCNLHICFWKKCYHTDYKIVNSKLYIIHHRYFLYPSNIVIYSYSQFKPILLINFFCYTPLSDVIGIITDVSNLKEAGTGMNRNIYIMDIR